MLGLFLAADFLAGMGETFVSVGVIAALFYGGEKIIKALFGKNENKEAEYKHQERIIELMQSNNTNSEKLLTSIDGLRTDVTGLRTDLSGLNERVLKLEEKSLDK